ncbi:MAG: DUF2520 domain-containing protein [Chitinophagaceae bacterium]
MQIVIIGTGNIATVLSKKITIAGHKVVQVYGRSKEAASAFASALQTSYCTNWNEISQDADIYIIALSDSALLGNAVQLKLKEQLIVHTAGAVAMDVLKNISANYGILYPLQTIRKETDHLPAIPFLVDACNEVSKDKIIALAKTISTDVSLANDSKRIKYHLAAVVANNFSNYLYTLAENYCKNNGLQFNHLLPLIDETTARLHHFSPGKVQTGPAIRKDMATIHRHLDLLNDEPALQKVYQQLSEAILAHHW